jgi:hypothetical protein
MGEIRGLEISIKTDIADSLGRCFENVAARQGNANLHMLIGPKSPTSLQAAQ